MNKRFDEEFQIGKARRSNLDNFSLNRYWQKGYNIDRFSKQYISNCYSNAPQAVYKIISFGRGISAKSMMEYVNTRDGIDQEFWTESGEVLKGKEDIDELYKTWSSEFRKKGSGRGEQRHITHMLLSADVESTAKNSAKVLDAARQTLFDEFGKQGYEYTYVLHTDTEHPHVHVVIKNYNSFRKRKLRLDRHDLLRIRTDFANDLTKRNLKRHIATLKRDRPNVLHRVEENLEKIKKQKENFNSLLDKCSYMSRKTQLNAQLTKELPKEKGFNNQDIDNANIKIDSRGSDIKVISNKNGKAFQEALLNACNDVLKDKKISKLKTNKDSSIVIEDVDILSIEDRKLINKRFKKIIREKAFKTLKGIPKQYDFNNTKLEFDTSKGFLQLRVNKIGSPFEKTLRKVCFEEFKSKKIGVVYYGQEQVNVRDIKHISIEQKKLIEKRFNKLIRKKTFIQQEIKNNKIIQRTKNVLPMYQALMNRTNNAIKWVKKSNLSFMQKKEQLKELTIIKNKLLNNYDLKEIQKASLLSSSNEQLKIFKELDNIERKKPTAKEKLNRFRALQAFRDKQKKELGNRIKYFDSIGDKDTVSLLKGMQSVRNYKQMQKQHKKVKSSILSK